VLTATRSWPTPATKFILLGIAISLGVFGLLRVSWVETHALLPLTLAQGALAVRLFGVPSLPIDVTLACSGADAIALCLGAILAFPAAWPRRVAGAAGGLSLIIAINVLRIGTLGRAAASTYWFDALHLYIWPAVLTLAIAGYVLLWMRQPRAAKTVTAPRIAKLPRLSRRFVILAGAFLLLFISAAPFYLDSTSIETVAGFVAKSAAAILTIAGVPAHATANILWGPHGGFLVTVECLVTPLIPIYLAAVMAYSSNWKRMSLGIVAAGPLFVALGVMRLLVVAFPDSVSSQVFFIHAFYQLLTGAAIVFGAAYWRHRDRRTLAFGICGIAAGAAFVAIAGPMYLSVVASVTGLPPNDPQGAIAFLPAFQTGLYLALWIAAYSNESWRRFVAGLAILVATQVAGLFALNALADHLSLTMAVRDVRGWALAAPVLAFAAVVLLGRARR
jgi:exosortase/archaeosortase family protein